MLRQTKVRKYVKKRNPVFKKNVVYLLAPSEFFYEFSNSEKIFPPSEVTKNKWLIIEGGKSFPVENKKDLFYFFAEKELKIQLDE